MSPRTTTIMTIAVLTGIALLFLLNTATTVLSSADTSGHLTLDAVRGMTLYHHKQPYTLSFDQQNNVVALVNRAIPVGSEMAAKVKPIDIDRLVIHLFGHDDVEMFLLGLDDENDLVIKVPSWKDSEYLQDLSSGEFYTLLSSAHDP